MVNLSGLPLAAASCLQTPQERGFATRRIPELPRDHAGEVGPHLAALVILVILARTSGGVTINWCTPLQHLTARAPTLCLPCALAEACPFRKSYPRVAMMQST